MDLQISSFKPLVVVFLSAEFYLRETGVSESRRPLEKVLDCCSFLKFDHDGPEVDGDPQSPAESVAACSKRVVS